MITINSIINTFYRNIKFFCNAFSQFVFVFKLIFYFYLRQICLRTNILGQTIINCLGDLSFFYDINGIWNRHTRNNLRILLINNGGGEIFHLLPGLNKASSLDTYVCCRHNTRAGEWAEAMGFDYYVATNEDEFSANLPLFVSNTSIRPLLFEIITSMEVNAEVFKTYYHHLKTI